MDPADDLTGKTLVVVNAPNPLLFLGLPVLRDYQDKPLPAGTPRLVPGYNPFKITRTDEKTLLIETRAGSLLTIDPSHRDLKPNFVYFYHELSSLFRPNDMRFKPGEKIELSDMSAEVISVDADRKSTRLNSSHGYISY